MIAVPEWGEDETMTTLREHYVHQLEGVRSDLQNLGSMVETALQRAIRSLEIWNPTVAGQVIADHAAICEVRHNVEEAVTKIIAHQHPVALDLRLLGSVFAIATELERIGDYASSIARRPRKIPTLPSTVPFPPELFDMAALAQKMLHLALEAFLHQEIDSARSLADYDNQVDELETRLRDELLVLAHQQPDQVETIFDLIFLVHALERVADRATNIGERVVYMQTSAKEDLNP